eukprot:6346210-Prymnesium_polylepis.1
MTEVEVEDSSGETLLGQMPFNYSVSFADGEASSLLQLDIRAQRGRARWQLGACGGAAKGREGGGQEAD